MLIVECLAFNGKIVDNIDYSIIQLFNYSITVSLSVLIGAFRHRMLHNLRMLASV